MGTFLRHSVVPAKWLVGKIISRMTYNVSSGTLNSTPSVCLRQLLGGVIGWPLYALQCSNRSARLIQLVYHNAWIYWKSLCNVSGKPFPQWASHSCLWNWRSWTGGDIWTAARWVFCRHKNHVKPAVDGLSYSNSYWDAGYSCYATCRLSLFFDLLVMVTYAVWNKIIRAVELTR